MRRSTLKNICKLIEESQTDVAVQQAFVRDLKRSIELTDEKDLRKPSQTYKPSSMNCIRNMYYQRSGTEPDKAVSNSCLVGICESGTDRHKRVQDAVCRMKDNGIDCEYIDVEKFVRERNLQDLEIVEKQGNETKLFSISYNVSFLCDGIIRYHGHYYILEIKTESVYKWTNRDSVDATHETQATAYSLLLDIPEVLFLYINRDNCDMKAYLYEPTAERKTDLVNTLQECETAVKASAVPAKPDDLPRKVCEYCNYKTQCRKDL